MVLGKLNRYLQKKGINHLLTPHTRINSKWIKDLSVRPKITKIIEENIGSKILDIACSNILSDISPQERETKEKINKWVHQAKKTFHSKRNHR